MKAQKKLLATAALATFGGLLAAGSALADPVSTGWYAGGGINFASTPSLGSHVDGALAAQGLGSTATSTHGGDAGAGLRLGYRLSPELAVEATYDHLDRIRLQTALPGDTAAGTWKAHGLGLHVLGSMPLNDKLSLTGRLGVERWRTALDLGSTTGGATALSRSSSNTALAMGAGLSYAINPQFDATAELVHYSRVGNASATGHTGLSTVNFGLLYHFG